MEDQWLEFALRQAARSAPHPAPDSLQGSGASAGYRLSLLFLESLPLFQPQDRNFDVRLGVTLYDEAAGCFFGPTAHGAAVQYDMRRSKGRQGFHVDVSCPLFFHTRVNLCAAAAAPVAGDSGPGSSGGSSGSLLAVVEVVLVERNADGVACGEYSGGWCAVPLRSDVPAGTGATVSDDAYAPRMQAAWQAAAPASPDKVPLMGAASACCCLQPSWMAPAEHSAWFPAALADGGWSPLRNGRMAAQQGAAGRLCVPVFVGSPRYLLLSRLLAPQQRLHPTPLLADGAACRLHYELQPCPCAATWAPLVPENCLVSTQDFVPGLELWSQAGGGDTGGCKANASAQGIPTQLSPPRLRGVHAATLSGLSVHLPAGFLDAVRKHAASCWRRAHDASCAGGGGAAGGQTLPLRDLAGHLALRVSAHNGRRFVGPPSLCRPSLVEPVEGRRGEHRLLMAGDARLAWLPADRCVALVAELLLELQPGAGGGGEEQERVLGWAAIMPFKRGGRAGSELVPAEGLLQAPLRSGPGRWLRRAPVLDWRRMIESSGRSGPAAPLVSCTLHWAPGPGVWPPPPAAPLPMRPSSALPVLRCQPGALCQEVPGHEHEASVEQRQQSPRQESEAGTLLSARSSQRGQPAQQPQNVEPSANHTTVQAWRIAAQPPASLPSAGFKPLASIRAKPTKERSEEEQAALFSGSPTAKLAATRGWEAPSGEMSAVEAAIAAAAEAECAAAPQEAVSARQLLAEVEDVLSTVEASLQLLAYEAPSPALALQLPAAMHFSFRIFSAQPTVTESVHLHAIPARSGCSPAGGQLFALLPSESLKGATSAPPPAMGLALLQTAELQQLAKQLGELAPPAGLLRQQRMRLAQYLAEGRLQVDVWDSDSMLQVGTLSIPLHSLLRQGRPVAEAVLRISLQDWSLAVSRQDAGGATSQLSAAALQGNFLVRLACRGQHLDVHATSKIAGASSWPAFPDRQGGRPLVLLAGSALEEVGGATAAEVARQEGLTPESTHDRLRNRVADRAACRVQRLLHFQSSPRRPAALAGDAAAAPNEELVEQEVVRGVAEARERCKRDAILRRLQAQLPAVEVLVVAPGDTAAFEREFVNRSSQQARFEVCFDKAASQAGLTDLTLVTDEAEWQLLSRDASLAGQPLRGKPASVQPVTAAAFSLGPQEACLLRFKLSRRLTEAAGPQQGSGTLLAWHSISVRRVKMNGHPAQLHRPAQTASTGDEPAATIRVAAVLPAAPVVHRTLRLYCPAGSGAATHAVQVSELPGAQRLLAGHALAAACSSSAVSAEMRGGQVLLCCSAPPPRCARRTLIALHEGSPGSSSPLEVWELYIHGLPTVRLTAEVGGSAAASHTLPPEAAACVGQQPALSWQRGQGFEELRALVQHAHAAGGGGAEVALRYEPATVGRRELLLSAAGRELLLVALHSTGTINRSFSVVLERGQAASKKVRYRSPYGTRRRFVVRSLAPQLLRIADRSAAFELEGGGAAAIKITLSGDAAAAALSCSSVSRAGQAQQQGCCEALVVLESAPVEGGGATRVEEVFRELLSLA